MLALKRSLPLLAALTATTPAIAATDYYIGYTPAVGSYTIESEEGDSRTTSALSWGSLSYLFQFSSRRRVNIGADYLDFSVDAKPDELGQDAQGFLITGEYDYLWRPARGFRIWLGAGVAVQQMEYSNRVTVDSDGYLDQRFADRSETDFAGLLSASYAFELTRHSTIEAQLKYMLPSGEGLRGWRLGVAFYPDLQRIFD